MNLIILFTLLSIFNVILQTLKSIVTINGGKTSAAFVNAITFGVYTFVIVYINADMSIWLKAGITALTNFIGVWVVKYIEERSRKDKLWKIEMTCPIECEDSLLLELSKNKIPYSYLTLDNRTDYSYIMCYCNTQADSMKVKNLTKTYPVRYFVTEQNGSL